MSENNTQHDDEIDLIELIANLWQEKWSIVICTGITVIVAIGYLLITKPIYLATTQLTPPTTAELAALNNSELIQTSPDEVLGDVLAYLASDKLNVELIDKNRSLIADINDIEESEVSYEKFGKALFSIKYPEVKKDADPLLARTYSLEKEGSDRELITAILNDAITIAKNTLINEWQISFITKKQSQLELLNDQYTRLDKALSEQKNDVITTLTEQDALKEKQLNDELTIRKVYLLKRRDNDILELEEALRIADSLNIAQPSTLRLLSEVNTKNNSQIEVNTDLKEEKEPLYLRGTNLLNAELENLQSIADDVFIDNRILEIERELLQLQKNSNIEILTARKDNRPFSEELQKLSEDINKTKSLKLPENINLTVQINEATAFTAPIKPKKSLILIISIFLGGMVGLFVAIGRIVYKSRFTNAI